MQNRSPALLSGWLRLPIALLCITAPGLLLSIIFWSSTTTYGNAHRHPGGEGTVVALVGLCIFLALWLIARVIAPRMTRLARVSETDRVHLSEAARGKTLTGAAFFSGAGCLLTFAVNLALGYAALGAKPSSTYEPDDRGEMIRARARELWGDDQDPEGKYVVGRTSGFGVDIFVQAIATPPGTTYSTDLTGDHVYNYCLHAGLYEEYGWPLRCIRTPLTNGGYTASDVSQILEELPEQYANLRILPLGFAVDALLVTCALVACRLGPGWVRSAIRRRRGQCIHCGYVLKDLPRCPECGNPR